MTLKLHPESRDAFEHFCHISPPMVAELNCFIENTKDKSRLLDVGALHGIFSLVFTHRGGESKAVAVDASPLAFARLLYNIHKNGLPNILPVECAVSDAPGILKMHYEWEHAVAATSEGSNQNTLNVIKKTGDALCEELSFKPDVIKIDVEGHEVKVVRGLAKQIRACKPLVFLEFHPGRIKEEQDPVADLLDVFTSCGYAAFLVDGTPVRIEDIPGFTEDQRLFLKPQASGGDAPKHA
jgi:FkbM family methyltransferase